MKHKVLSKILIIFFIFLNSNYIFADSTTKEGIEGKIIWTKFLSKEVKCENLNDKDFGNLGEYFMGLMAGYSHGAMNDMMVRQMGENAEEQMHVSLGKRISNCDVNALIPTHTMINHSMFGSGMMGGGMMNFGFMPFNWIFMILVWALVILAIVALIKWLINQNKK